MTKKQNLLLSKILFALSLSMGCFTLYFAIAPNTGLRLYAYFMISVFIFACVNIGVFFLNRAQPSIIIRRKNAYIACFVLFIYYLVMVICHMLLNAYGDRLSNFSLTEHFRVVHPYPFQTVYNTMVMWKHNLDLNYLFSNLLGNFFAFAPLGYFLPMLWKKMRKPLPYFTASFAICAGLEFIQGFFCLGEFDTDDILFTCVGAVIAYIIFMKTKLKDFVIYK